MPSRYQLTADDLRKAALALQIGGGIADRVSGSEAEAFIEESEDWADGEAEEFLGVPLKPVPAPGQIDFDPQAITKRNFPHHFIQAVTYRATGLLLQSEFFQSAPNASEAGKWCLDTADRYMQQFKSRPTTRVGSGRRRHWNPFVPPQIVPPEPDQIRLSP